MLKGIIILIVIAGLSYFGLQFLGYEIHTQNLSYYLPKGGKLPDTGDGPVAGYLNYLKQQQRMHPLLTKKLGSSGADELNKGTTEALKKVLQADKLETFDKLKSDIQGIQAVSNERNQQIAEAMGES